MSATQPHSRPVPAGRFHVHVEPDRDTVRVCPAGEVDLATVGEVRSRIDELVAAGFQRLVIDLRQTTFLDSSGLRLLLEVDAASRAAAWKLAIIEGPLAVQRAFEITGLRSVLPFEGTGTP